MERKLQKLDSEFSAWLGIINAFVQPAFIINDKQQVIYYNSAARNIVRQNSSTLCHQVIYNKDKTCENCIVFGPKTDLKHIYESSRSATIADNDENSVNIIKGSNRYFVIESKKQDINNVQERLITLGAVSLALAHEISNPITGLNLSIQSLKNTLSQTELGENQEKIMQMARFIEQDTHRASEILYDLQSHGKPALLTSLNLRQVIENSIAVSKRTHPCVSVQIEWLWSLKDLFIVGNQRKMEQVFINIFNNSMEAFLANKIYPQKRLNCWESHVKSENSVDLTLKIEGFESAGPENQYVTAKITDNSGGITRDRMEKVFQPCFTTKVEHTGMGLFIVKKILDEHNANAHFDSKDDRTTVAITLPAVQ